jgi:serine/threonine protein kinase
MNIVDKSLEVDGLLSEIQLMRGLSHKHIVEYLGTYVDSEEFYLYIFQEWVPGGSVAHLLKKFGPFTFSVVRNYTRQILLGLEYLHSHHIIHRDIKGGNILVDDIGIVKLADFGASTKLSSEFDKTQEMKTLKGTPYFMAPEVLCSSHYGRKGDIWAVGCTVIQMLTGDPPWKDQNLSGIAQLGYLLSTWNKGPPPFTIRGNEELTPDAKECLDMCFRKEENERPNATELLTCRFLRMDEADLEDSNNSSFRGNNSLTKDDRNYSFNNSSQRDILEDSGVLTGLKQEINKAVTKSQAGLPPYHPSGGGIGAPSPSRPVGNQQQQQHYNNMMSETPQQSTQEDTFQMIERRMRDDRNRQAAVVQQQQQQQIKKQQTPRDPFNPYSSRPDSANSNYQRSDSPGNQQRLIDKLPYGNNFAGLLFVCLFPSLSLLFFASLSVSPFLDGPKYSREPTPLTLQQVQPSSSTVNSTVTTPSSANPYRSVNKQRTNSSSSVTPIVMRSQFEQQPPVQQQHHPNHPNPFSPPSITFVSNNLTSPSFAPVSTPKPSLTPVTVSSNANNNMNPENLRDSLSIVKRKALERIGSASGSRDGGTTPSSARRPLSSGGGGAVGLREGNQSTNRDSEDITPLIADEDDDDDQAGDLIDRGESKRPTSSGSFYDTRYFEEKQRPLEQEYKLNDVEDMGAAAALGGGKKANLALYLMKKQYPKMEREVSVESVSDDVGDDYIKSYSNDEREEGGNKTPGSRSQQQLRQNEVKYMQSNNLSNNRRYVYPSKFLPGEAGGVPVQAINSNDVPPNIHHNFLKKSSSPTGATALANKSKSSSPVPRLTAVEDGRLSRRDLNEKKASSSTSARIVRPEPVVDPIARPYSSKASFTYNDKPSSKANSAVNSPHTPDDRHHIEPAIERAGSAGMMSSASTPALAPYNSNTNGRGLPSWRCGNRTCNVMNSGSAPYCEKCATVKGHAGERKLESYVPRL